MPNSELYLSILSPQMTQRDLLKTISDLHSLIDGVHFDVMDGKFVEANTLYWQTPKLLRVLKNEFPNLKYSVHLMTLHPHSYIRRYAAAGAQEIFVHCEATSLNQIGVIAYKLRKRKVKVGLAINPETNLNTFSKVSNVLDSVLIMSVHPGTGGQKFILDVCDKVQKVAQKFPKVEIAVDGGIDAKYAEFLKILGTKQIVVGSAILKQKHPFEAAYKIKKILKQN